MPASKSEFVGLREANLALRNLPEYAREKAQAVMDTSAYLVQQGAADRAPVLTGRLKFSIQRQSRPKSVMAVVGIDKNAMTYPFWWKFIEYGTVKIAARPMFRPAAMAIEGDHQARLDQALAQAAAMMERESGVGGGGRYV